MNTAADLTIARAELNEAFRLLKKLCKPRPDEEAVLSYDGGCLHIELGGMTVTPGAAGTWSGQVRIPGSYLMGLVKLPPAGDPLVVKVENGRLHFGSSSIGCTFQDAWTRVIELPMNPTTTQILSLQFEFSPEEIEASGYAKVVRETEERAALKIARAALELEGLQISAEAIREFVYAHLKRGNEGGALPVSATKTFYYFGYGSNLKLSEIHRSCPTAKRKCRVRLPNYALCFPRKSLRRDCGVASIEPSAGGEVWGGVYEISELERESLESREGFKRNRQLDANSYVPATLRVFEDGDAAKPLEVLTFVANPQPNPPLPNSEYKNLIIAGACEWNINAKYIARLEQITTSNENDTRLLTELKTTAAKLNYSPEALIVLGTAAIKHQQNSIMPNFPPFPQITDEAVIDTENLAVWPDWVAKLIPAGSKWQRLEWPNGGTTIRLVDPQRAVVAAAYIAPTESKQS